MAETVAIATLEAYNNGKNLFSLINRKVDFAKKLEKNYTRMRDEAAKLYARRDDYEAEANTDRGKQLKKECAIWIKAVGKIEEEVRELERKYTNEMDHRWGWHWFWSISQLSKKLAEMCSKLHSIWEDGKFETGIMVEKLPECVKKIHGPKIEDNTSLHRVVEQILDFLRDTEVERIGLWGTPGIGKPTILQNLNDDENIGEMFDIVIWVTLSQSWSIEDVQQAIVQRLGLNTKACSTIETAYKISEALENNKYLLILDESRILEVWPVAEGMRFWMILLMCLCWRELRTQNI